MDFVLEIINTYGLEIIGAILTALGGVVALAAKNLATKYIDTKVKRDIAHTVVQGVEQLYKHLSGSEKLDIALDTAAEMLAAQGITVTDLELRMLLEAAVGEFNNVFAWNLPILEGIAAEDMTDDQLRAVLQQMGFGYTDTMTREEMLAALDEEAETLAPA